jgi:signal peptidase I
MIVYASAAVIALFFTGGIFTFTPLLGISLAHTEGVSMEPFNRSGDVVLLQELDGSKAKIGEVIVFEDRGQSVMHRLKERYMDSSGQLMLITQGDNVPVPDPPIAASQVTARMVTEVPILGDISRMLNGKGGFYIYRSIVVSICVSSLAVWGLAAFARAQRSAHDEEALH